MSDKNRDSNNYKSVVAETIEASGNFVNNAKDKLFILLLIFMIGGVFLIYCFGSIAYKFLDTQAQIKVELQKQTTLIIRQTENSKRD